MGQTAARLVLYHRYGCHLCEDMLDRLRELEVAWGFSLQIRDVDAEPELVRWFDDKVPLLQGDGDEICRYVLNEQALGAFVKTQKLETRLDPEPSLTG